MFMNVYQLAIRAGKPVMEALDIAERAERVETTRVAEKAIRSMQEQDDTAPRMGAIAACNQAAQTGCWVMLPAWVRARRW